METDYETDYEEADGHFASDGLDYDTMDTDADARDEEGEEHDEPSPRVAAYLRRVRSGSAEAELDEEDWLDSVSASDERDWGLTDGDSMSMSEGELSPGEHHYGLRVSCFWTTLY